MNYEMDNNPEALEFSDWREFRDMFASLVPSMDVSETIENNFKWESRFWEWRERGTNPYYKTMFGEEGPEEGGPEDE